MEQIQQHRRVSVIIPTFNRVAKLVAAIESVEHNEFPETDYEIIVVDDCSTDQTTQEVKRLQYRNRNIQYVRNSVNRGPAYTRNQGIQRACGDYILFTDDDCIVPCDWIQYYVDFMDRHVEVACAGGTLEPPCENMIAKIERLKNTILGTNAPQEKIGGQEIPTGFTNNVVFRAPVLKRVGGFDENYRMPAGEDIELKNRIAACHQVAITPKAVLHNQEYNLDYLLACMIKQCLEKRPPRKTTAKMMLLLLYSPKVIYTIAVKTSRYRTWFCSPAKCACKDGSAASVNDRIES